VASTTGHDKQTHGKRTGRQASKQRDRQADRGSVRDDEHRVAMGRWRSGASGESTRPRGKHAYVHRTGDMTGPLEDKEENRDRVDEAIPKNARNAGDVNKGEDEDGVYGQGSCRCEDGGVRRARDASSMSRVASRSTIYAWCSRRAANLEADRATQGGGAGEDEDIYGSERRVDLRAGRTRSREREK